MVSSVNSHTNATRIGWHLWEMTEDLPLGYLQGGKLEPRNAEGDSGSSLRREILHNKRSTETLKPKP